MTTLLVRTHKSPFLLASPEETLRRNLIGDNVGNLVFAEAAIRLLSVQGVEVRTRRLNRESPGAEDEEHDHLVIPLANAFRQSFVARLETLAGIMERQRRPVTILGVGAQERVVGRPARPELDSAVTRFVRAALERGPSIGVRGERTAAYLADLGFGDDVVDVIGCPSMFMWGPRLQVERRLPTLDARSPISLNISPYVSRIGQVSLDQAARYPNLTYTAQDHRTLTLMLEGHYPPGQRVGADNPTTLDHPLVAENRVRLYLDPQPWIRALRTVEFSFGTRIHGNIVALLAGTPAVVLAHDSRTLELAEYHGIPYRVLDRSLPHPDAAELYAEADFGPLNAGHAERWARFQAFLAKHGLHHVHEEGWSDNGTGQRLDEQDYPVPHGVQMGLIHDLPRLYSALGTGPGGAQPSPARGKDGQKSASRPSMRPLVAARRLLHRGMAGARSRVRRVPPSG